MKITKALAIYAFMLVLAVAAEAQAYTVDFGDSFIANAVKKDGNLVSSSYWPGYYESARNDRRSWTDKDVIGIPDFTGGSVTMANGYVSSIKFNYKGNDVADWGKLTVGDLFIGFDNGSGPITGNYAWDYVVRLENTAGTYSVYSFAETIGNTNAYQMSQNTWGYGQGSYIIRDNNPVRAADSFLTADKKIGEVTFSGWSGLSNETVNQLLSSTITFAGSGLHIDGKALTLAWTTNCANDLIMERVAATPIPGAVWLMGAGMIGLVGIRKRFQTV